MSQALLEVNNLVKHFTTGTQTVKAVDGISLSINQSETLGLVGESGCGKSTTGRLTLRLIESTSGEINFEGQNINDFNKRNMKKMRKEMQMIFQDPYASLDPRQTIGETIMRPLMVHQIGKKKDRYNQVLELMEKVGLDPRWVNRFPHELDGGRRQRVGIARALAVNPKYIVCDEPVSALDVSIQAQVLNLMQDIQEEFNLTYLFISHDLSVVKHVSDRIAVMYLGKIVELAEAEELFHNTQHPYTKALLSAVPVPTLEEKPHKIVLEGDVPSPKNPPSGCRFHTRCPFAEARCKVEEPELREVGSEHFVACHLV
ncbi:oligopeptide/dipeptide ABC transporter ATP-binding protein [Evansella vedderi]|uniref:Oligopeptide/dipeptide ABC transporter ATP-binding protein n=1 Tax=Evansella vedderi TaxID=38282 RepID=A0ABT9ZQD6_9BACI|nr:ABC transporter ATP-binding protein [Evansella vedderi]MDQ0252941.1 oligopeptide/dipeptide ABC transporter ATP-binding protein [Evansella vedderi]